MEDKVVWGVGTPWKNSTAFFTYLRGCLRKAWSRHPTRIAVVNKQRKQIINPRKGHRATVWGFTCCICKKEFTIKEAQVDHIVPAGSLQKASDIQGFTERLLFVTEEDLRLVCKGCNSTLAYSDKQGISMEDAIIEKGVIEICKRKAAEIDSFLLENGVTLTRKNKDTRRDAVREILSRK